MPLTVSARDGLEVAFPNSMISFLALLCVQRTEVRSQQFADPYAGDGFDVVLPYTFNSFMPFMVNSVPTLTCLDCLCALCALVRQHVVDLVGMSAFLRASMRLATLRVACGNAMRSLANGREMIWKLPSTIP